MIEARYLISQPAKTRGVISQEGTRSRNRVFEWCSSGALFGDGILFILSPGSLRQSAFSPILDAFPPGLIAFLFLLTGGMRIIALWHNGRWPIVGPSIRIVGAVIGAVAWSSMGFALLLQVFEVGRSMSPGVPVYAALCIAELYSARRAAADVRARL
jgi:hypothetical protein